MRAAGPRRLCVAHARQSRARRESAAASAWPAASTWSAHAGTPGAPGTGAGGAPPSCASPDSHCWCLKTQRGLLNKKGRVNAERVPSHQRAVVNTGGSRWKSENGQSKFLDNSKSNWNHTPWKSHSYLSCVICACFFGNLLDSKEFYLVFLFGIKQEVPCCLSKQGVKGLPQQWQK